MNYPGMIGVKMKTQSRTNAVLRDKRRHLDSIDSYIIGLVKQLNNGDGKSLQQLLDFFGAGRKCSRWSYWNLVGLIRRRPDIRRPAPMSFRDRLESKSEFSISGLRDSRTTKRDLELNLRAIVQISREIRTGLLP
jgi:hypothetical protein